MEVKSPKELAKLADICRKRGIERIKIDSNGIEFSLKDLPSKVRRKKGEPEHDEQTPQYAPADALFWSSAGLPDEAQN